MSQRAPHAAERVIGLRKRDALKLLRTFEAAADVLREALAADEPERVPEKKQQQQAKPVEDWIGMGAAVGRWGSEEKRVTARTIQRWCERYGIGRKIGGHWQISISLMTAFRDGKRPKC